MQTPRFLHHETAYQARIAHGTPLYVYDEETLMQQATAALSFPNAFGLTVRYAMKASPNAVILQIFNRMGIQIDASSLHEVRRAIRAGVPPSQIALSTQELPADFSDIQSKGFVGLGVQVNACSLNQLVKIGQSAPGSEIGIRFNPGLGSGANNRTNVGGPASSFGVWHGNLDKAKKIVKEYNLKVVRIHTHIGSGSDPEVWKKVALMSLGMVKEFPDAHTLDLGGGFKVARMPEETATNLKEIGTPVKAAFEKFAQETGRKIKLEIEPGTFLVANAGALLATVQDMTDTGEGGYEFLKLDTGMTEILRPSLYGSQHPITTLPQNKEAPEGEFVVVGHCCESGDILTPAPDHPEVLATRKLQRPEIGDLCVIDGVGAYCSAMPAKNYNSFPEAPEALLSSFGGLHIIRKRQTLGQLLENEISLPLFPS